MRKSLSRLFYLLGLLTALVGILLLVRGYLDGAVLSRDITHPLYMKIALVGLILCISAVLLSLTAWIGALIRMAQLHRWGWFSCLLIFSGVAMFLYISLGPTTAPSRLLLAPPYQGFGD